MTATTLTRLFALLLAAAVGGCGSGAAMNPMDPGTGGTPTANGTMPGDGLNPAVQRVNVSGQIVDFQSGQPLTSQATMLTNGMSPAPTVTVMGADYMVTGIPPYSVFFLQAMSPPTYRDTFSLPVSVAASDVTNLAAPVVKDQYVSDLAKAFGINPMQSTAVVFVQVVDAMGNPVVDVPASAFQINGAAPKPQPFFLDAMKQAAPMLTATGPSGWVVFFNVPAGSAHIAANLTANSSLATTVPTTSNGASLALLSASGSGTSGGTTQPTTKTESFATDVVPIFTNRGCVNCHSADGPGKNLGGLALNGATQKIWDAVVTQISPNFNTTRVDLMDPAKSLILTMPLYENPPDAHPVAVFPSTADKDYQTILAWITQGAKLN